jgi:hypothetical protein
MYQTSIEIIGIAWEQLAEPALGRRDGGIRWGYFLDLGRPEEGLEYSLAKVACFL